jgi:cell shape-determining protein MreD
MLRLRAPDVFFAVLALAIAALLASDMAVIVFALVGAFACGAIHVFAGMIPARTESFATRAFVSVFLSLVLASLVLILPGTFGARRPDIQGPVLAIAALLPLLALLFEIVRTPRLIEHVLRGLRLR